MNNLKYITYQSFPSNKANTIQTIDNLKYLKKFFNIEVIFPIRETESSDNLELLTSIYGNINGIKFNGKKHYLPFGRINLFERVLFHLSHYIWSKNICKNYIIDERNYFFTRSDWIFYFLSKKGKNVTFECHQLSKLRKLEKEGKVFIKTPCQIDSLDNKNKLEFITLKYSNIVS